MMAFRSSDCHETQTYILIIVARQTQQLKPSIPTSGLSLSSSKPSLCEQRQDRRGCSLVVQMQEFRSTRQHISRAGELELRCSL